MLKVTVHDNFTEQVAHALAKGATKAEHIVAIQAAKDTSPYVPMDTGSLNTKTQIDGGTIIYPGPYARFLYYGKVMVDPETGSSYAKAGATKTVTDKNLVFSKEAHQDAQAFWFEASKAQNMDKWTRVAAKAVENDLNK